MQRLLWSIAVGVLVVGTGLSCGRQRAPGGGDTVGTVSLPLQATAASGNVYQLRNATFSLTGPTTTMLTTAGTPDAAAALMATLQVGGYTAELLPGWTLFRVDPAGGAQAVAAQIVSANPASFTVASQLQTTVGFAFDTAGTIVDTSQGTARIIITVTERDAAAVDAGPMCSPVGGPCGRAGGTCCSGAICPPLGNDTCIACRQIDQSCAAASDCCTGSCVNGSCTDGACSPVGGPCGRTGGTCCSGAVCPVTSDVCMACRQSGQSCNQTSDCCGGNTCTANRCVATTLTPPAFGAAGAGVEGTGDLSVPYPAGVASGQLLILQIGSRSSNVPVTPAGWTLLAFDEHMNGRQRLYWRTATGTESGALAVAAGVSTVNVGRMYSFSGVSNPFTAEGSTVVTDDDGSPTGPTVATAGTGRLAVVFVALDNNPAMAPFTGETGGDWNEPVAEFASALGSNFSLQLQIAPMPSGGTIAGGSANFGGSSDGSICRAFALIGL